MTGFPTDCTQFEKDNSDLCCTIKRKHSMMLHSRSSQGWNTPKKKKKKRTALRKICFWALTAVMFASRPHQSPHQRSHLADHLSLFGDSSDTFWSIQFFHSAPDALAVIWYLVRSLGAMTFLKAVDAPVSGWSTIDEWMLVFSCLFSEPNWKRALAPALGPEVIDSKRSMWQPSLPRKWCHRLN